MYPNTSIRLQTHRGAGLQAPENTMAAYRLAARMGYEFIELDPKFTADGVCVLFHDRTVGRTCRLPDGSPLPEDRAVADMTYAELSALDAGVWRGEAFRGERVPTFREGVSAILGWGLSVKVDNIWERFSPAEQESLFRLMHEIITQSPSAGGQLGVTCARVENVARVARELPAAAIHFDGLVTDEVLAALDGAAAGRELYVWLRFHNEKTAWNKNPPATATYAAKVKAHGRLGIWLVDDEAHLPAVAALAPYVVETNGGLRPESPFRILNLRACPGMTHAAAEWFHGKWGIPTEAYLSCMEAYLRRENEYGWYLCLRGEDIVGGLGVVENDFHDRKDLSPNVCAVYVEERFRGLGLAGELLDAAVDDLRGSGISPVYLVTDRTGFYERYGWTFYGMAQSDGEEHMSRLYLHE